VNPHPCQLGDWQAEAAGKEENPLNLDVLRMLILQERFIKLQTLIAEPAPETSQTAHFFSQLTCCCWKEKQKYP